MPKTKVALAVVVVAAVAVVKAAQVAEAVDAGATLVASVDETHQQPSMARHALGWQY